MDPSKYTICCYTTNGAGAKHGAGGNFLYLRNPNLNHFQPIWTQHPAEAQKPAPPAKRPRRDPAMTNEAGNEKDDTLSDNNDWNLAVASCAEVGESGAAGRPSLQDL